jgi:hypothetical protein
MSLLDRITTLRLRLEDRPSGARRLLTLRTALVVAGGLVRLAIDDRPVEVALPEPATPRVSPKPAPPLPIAAAELAAAR